MATNANWTVIFEDKKIVKQSGDGVDAGGTGYFISDDSFWSDSKFYNIWAIQHGTFITSDEVEYRDDTPHSSFAAANIGDISQFSNRWDSAHLAKLQSNWDKNNIVDEEGNSTETESEKISRLGARPTSYSS
tara:strand:+ start:345 stop:740 length:396 start_codon:yes stop_codon:yes gene_type:complete